MSSKQAPAPCSGGIPSSAGLVEELVWINRIAVLEMQQGPLISIEITNVIKTNRPSMCWCQKKSFLLLQRSWMLSSGI